MSAPGATIEEARAAAAAWHAFTTPDLAAVCADLIDKFRANMHRPVFVLDVPAKMTAEEYVAMVNEIGGDHVCVKKCGNKVVVGVSWNHVNEKIVQINQLRYSPLDPTPSAFSPTSPRY